MNWEKLNQKREKLNLEEMRIKNQKKLLKLKEKKLKIQKFIQLGEELEKSGWDVLGTDLEDVASILTKTLAASNTTQNSHKTQFETAQ